jgi:hypothetical protein
VEHDDCPWARGRGPAQRPLEIRVTTDTAIRVVDRCPRCGGTTVKDFRFVPAQGPVVTRSAPELDDALMQCDCGEPHVGRPGGERRQGCGYAWKIRST